MQRPVAVSLAHRLSYISAAGAIAPKNSFIIPLRTVQTSRMGQLVSRAKKEDGSEPEPDLWMLVGLGNPGPRYEDTRHNVGFMAVDRLAQHAGVKIDRLQSNCAVGRGRVAEKKVLLVKPLTFMNVSGEGVIKLSRYYQVSFTCGHM